MMKVFNSTFETVLRILCLMSQTNCEMNAERIMLMDFIATYGKNYHVTETNLHGDDSASAAGLTARRFRIRRALKQMVQYGYIIPASDNAFRYRISDQGRKYCDLLNSEYAKEYSSAAGNAFRLYGGYSDTELMTMICKKYDGGASL